MADDSTGDPEIRRRAAWLLGMLALVAALVVVIFVVFFNGGSGGNSDDQAGPVTQTSRAPSTTGSTSTSASPSDISTFPSDSPSGTSTSSTASPSDTAASGSKPTCPSDQKCALGSDIGNAVAAVNAYRQDHGKSAVPGAYSADAAQCALSDGGSGCPDGFAESQVALKHKRADGPTAVDKVEQRADLLTDMKSFEVGWAWNPGSKTLYFAVIRKDS